MAEKSMAADFLGQTWATECGQMRKSSAILASSLRAVSGLVNWSRLVQRRDAQCHAHLMPRHMKKQARFDLLNLVSADREISSAG